jgi:hypothetical protein
VLAGRAEQRRRFLQDTARRPIGGAMPSLPGATHTSAFGIARQAPGDRARALGSTMGIRRVTRRHSSHRVREGQETQRRAAARRQR